MNYCKIENGVVTNVSHWESPMPAGWADPADTWVQSDVAGPGWTYANGVFTAPVVPPPPPPSTNPADYPLRPDQFFAMLDIAGLTASVNAALDAISDPQGEVQPHAGVQPQQSAVRNAQGRRRRHRCPDRCHVDAGEGHPVTCGATPRAS
jgi:hypothetical protein